MYLPYGYDEGDTETKYNVIYFQHGNHGSPNQFWDHIMKAVDCNNLFANLFDDKTGLLEKCIIICPTYYFDIPEDSFVTPDETDAGDGMPGASKKAYYKEIVEDLIPQIESRFHVYCDDFSEAGIKAYRDHRAWAGYSRGAFCTWNVMYYDFEYFKYWIPCSGTITAIDGRDTSTPDLQYAYIKEAIDAHPDLDFFLMGYIGGSADQKLMENYIPLMQCF